MATRSSAPTLRVAGSRSVMWQRMWRVTGSYASCSHRNDAPVAALWRGMAPVLSASCPPSRSITNTPPALFIARRTRWKYACEGAQHAP